MSFLSQKLCRHWQALKMRLHSLQCTLGRFCCWTLHVALSHCLNDATKRDLCLRYLRKKMEEEQVRMALKALTAFPSSIESSILYCWLCVALWLAWVAGGSQGGSVIRWRFNLLSCGWISIEILPPFVSHPEIGACCTRVTQNNCEKNYWNDHRAIYLRARRFWDFQASDSASWTFMNHFEDFTCLDVLSLLSWTILFSNFTWHLPRLAATFLLEGGLAITTRKPLVRGNLGAPRWRMTQWQICLI